MKTMFYFLSLLLLGVQGLIAQSPREKLSLLTVDASGLTLESRVLANMLRVELEKTGRYNVTDRYEIEQFMREKNISMENCFGKSCLVEVGKLNGSDKMFGAGIEVIGKNIAITYRLFDVATSDLERIYVREFLNIPTELQNMIKLSIAEMFMLPYDNNLMIKLTKANDFESLSNAPASPILHLDGPRMGYTFYTGELAQRVSAAKSIGGLDSPPMMFQCGYQFEKSYLNEGNAQALVEFIPMLTGFDQQLCIPSLAIMNGIRSNVNGYEFAIGPTFNFVRMASGYYDNWGNWHLENEFSGEPGEKNPFEIVDRLDRRGSVKLRSAVVIAAGRTFKSGRLNIPVNVYLVPGNTGFRCGFSVGFNARKS